MAYERLVGKLTTDNIWLYVIRLLKERPMYAYEIHKAIRNRFEFSPAIITIYFVLYKMEREGLVKSELKVELGGKGRRYYTVTDKGLKTFEQGKKFIEKVLSQFLSHT